MITVRKLENIDWTSLSAVSQGTTDAFLKLAILLVMSYEYDYDADTKRKASTWLADSEEFFKRFKFGKKEATIAVKHILANTNENNKAFDNAVSSLIESFNTNKVLLKSELDVDEQQLKMFHNIRLYSQRQSTSALNFIKKTVSSMFREPDITDMFIEEIPDVSNIQKSVEALVLKHGKVGGIQMPADKLSEWQEIAKKKGVKLPEHVEYLKLNRELRANFKTFLESFVRQSGKPYLPIHEVVRAAKEHSIPHTLPLGFVGNIDDQGKFYTTAGLELKQAPTGEVVMNPSYDPKKDNAYVCSFKAIGGKVFLRAYSTKRVSANKQKNFKTVNNILPKLKALSNKWIVDVGKLPKAYTKDNVLATLLEFVYQTGARPGAEGQATKGSATFGATSLRVKHVIKLDDHSVHIRYTGGKSTENTDYTIKFNTIRNKKFGNAIRTLVEGKGKEDILFDYLGAPLTSAALKKYMTSKGFPANIKTKNLRTAKATGMFVEAIKNCPYTKGGEWNDKQVNDWLIEQAKKVGGQLGHTSNGNITPTTAIQNYIDPFLVENFANKIGARLDAKFLNAIKIAKNVRR